MVSLDVSVFVYILEYRFSKWFRFELFLLCFKFKNWIREMFIGLMFSTDQHKKKSIFDLKMSFWKKFHHEVYCVGIYNY